MSKKNHQWYLENNESITDNFYKFTDKEGGLPLQVADYFDLLKSVNQSLLKRIEELNNVIKSNKHNFDGNNDTLDYVYDTYVNIVMPKLNMIQTEIDEDKKTICELENKSKKGGQSGAKYKPYQEIIKRILEKYLDTPRGDKFTQEKAQEQISNEIFTQSGKEMYPSLTAFKAWLECYKASERKSIYSN